MPTDEYIFISSGRRCRQQNLYILIVNSDYQSIRPSRRAVGPLAYFLDDDLGKSLALLGGSAADEAREVLAELSWQVMLIGENILEIFRRVINGVPYDKAQELLELFPFPFLLEGFGILFPLGSATVGFHF